MGKPGGFLEHNRREVTHRPVEERVGDFKEINVPHPEELLVEQAGRCMECGIPFCHGTGCPLQNRIPEFNDLIFRGRWQEACENLHSTNNFPEITGRVCPAPCETSCTLSINDEPVLIRHIEFQIVERGFEKGWILPKPASKLSGKRVAIVGSGPAGLAAAQQLARAGHEVTVFEKDDRIGGLLRYGIPDFKLDKSIIDRRLEQLSAEGVHFQTNVLVGEDISVRYLRGRFDAVSLAMGAGQPRDLQVPGRDCDGVVFAMDYLAQQNRCCGGDEIAADRQITAKDKVVVVIGGGDTGSDCVGTAHRQGAREIHQFEILPQPPASRADDNPWPDWPNIMRTSTSQQEGCQRRWSVMTKKLSAQNGRLSELQGCEVEWIGDGQNRRMQEIPGSEFSLPADLILLAMGFEHVVYPGLIEKFGLELDNRGNVTVDENFMTSEEGVFASGDTVEGASLVVRAIQSGRKAAAGVDRWLRNR